MSEPFRIVAKTFAGLEQVLAEELTALGAADVAPGNRLVSFAGDRRLLYAANLWCRTAVRVLRPVGTCAIADGNDPAQALYAGAAAVDWSEWLAADGTLAVDAIVPRRLFANSMFAALVTKDAIVDQFRARCNVRPSVDRQRPDLRVHVHVAGTQATLYVDAAGDSLHRRGYRHSAGEAPLGEVLAAGLVRLAGWRGDVPLVDFMCGSGTIAIEAAMWARRIAPGLVRREFGFMRWPDFDRPLYEALLAAARAAALPQAPAPIWASDLDAAAIAAARQNAERALVAGDVRFRQANFEALDPPATVGVVLINPPYDERLRTRHVGAFYRRLGQVLVRRWGGWQVHVLSGYPGAANALGLAPRRALRLWNGPIECRLLTFDVPAASSSLPMGAEIASPLVPARWREQTVAFTNRLARMARHWRRMARRGDLQAVRLYDRDIPEIPLSVEWYAGHVHVVEHDRPHERAALEHEQWLAGMLDAVAATLDVPRGALTVETLEFGPAPPRDHAPIAVSEGPRRLLVQLADGRPTGLPIDERLLREAVQQQAAGQRFASLFAGSATLCVAAAAGGAASTVAVEPDRRWLPLAQQNLAAGQWREPAHRVVIAEPAEFLAGCAAEALDLVCVTPPPGFGIVPERPPWDVRPAYVELLARLAPCVAPGGQVYVASRAGRPVLAAEDLPQYSLREVTGRLAAADCRRGPRFWSLRKVAARPDGGAVAR